MTMIVLPAVSLQNCCHRSSNSRLSLPNMQVFVAQYAGPFPNICCPICRFISQYLLPNMIHIMVCQEYLLPNMHICKYEEFDGVFQGADHDPTWGSCCSASLLSRQPAPGPDGKVSASAAIALTSSKTQWQLNKSKWKEFTFTCRQARAGEQPKVWRSPKPGKSQVTRSPEPGKSQVTISPKPGKS